MLPLDLHVLSLSLAFILSQDQTLHCHICVSVCFCFVLAQTEKIILDDNSIYQVVHLGFFFPLGLFFLFDRVDFLKKSRVRFIISPSFSACSLNIKSRCKRMNEAFSLASFSCTTLLFFVWTMSMIAVFLSHIPHHGTEPIKQRTVGAKVKPFSESAKSIGVFRLILNEGGVLPSFP